jgi:transposase InsO family protein
MRLRRQGTLLKTEIWRLEYNGIRPHSSLKYQTPEECRQGFSAGLNSITVEGLLPG